MTKKLDTITQKVNALSLRERFMVIVTIFTLCGFVWWNLFAMPVLHKTKEISNENNIINADIQVLVNTSSVLEKRINEGVFKDKNQKLALLQKELKRVTSILEEKTQALIEPDEMFALMQQLIFADSKLKLTSMKRKSVEPVFEAGKSEAVKIDDEKPEVYRHVLQVSFEGQYNHILQYVQEIEALEWKLIWDRITLETSEYPVVKVNIEMSTLSGTKNWVGL